MNTMENSLTNTREKWSVLSKSWLLSGPPAAPSPDDIKNFYNDTIPGNRVLILGATPALRKAAAEANLLHLSIDATPEMIAAANNYLSKELGHLILMGDWRDLPFPISSFDLVVGDKILGNLLPEDWPNLFSEISRVLKPEGRFITRATPNGKNRLEIGENRSLNYALAHWATQHSDGLSIDDTTAGLWEDCMNASIELISPQIGTQQLSRVLPKNIKDCLEKALLMVGDTTVMEALIERYWESRDALWSAYCESVIPESATPYLQFIELRFASDYEAARAQPCFVFSSLKCP